MSKMTFNRIHTGLRRALMAAAMMAATTPVMATSYCWAPVSGTMTQSSLTVTKNLAFTGTGQRITGDFSNATVANRVMFQSSTANGPTRVGIMPNGTSPAAELLLLNNSDPTNAGLGSVRMNTSDFSISATYNGAGTFLPMTFYTGGSERMRLDTSGTLRVNGTTNNAVLSSEKLSVFGSAGFASSAAQVLGVWNTNATGNLINFYASTGTAVGIISTNGTTTTYGTSSDYRLKDHIQPMHNALDRVARLKPVTYTWKVDGSYGEGFIAHELQEVVPIAVTGEKDAVDKKGKPIYQAIDPSKIIGLLTAAIQEQQAQIQEMKDEIQALKNAKGKTSADGHTLH